MPIHSCKRGGIHTSPNPRGGVGLVVPVTEDLSPSNRRFLTAESEIPKLCDNRRLVDFLLERERDNKFVVLGLASHITKDGKFAYAVCLKSVLLVGSATLVSYLGTKDETWNYVDVLARVSGPRLAAGTWPPDPHSSMLSGWRQYAASISSIRSFSRTSILSCSSRCITSKSSITKRLPAAIFAGGGPLELAQLTLLNATLAKLLVFGTTTAEAVTAKSNATRIVKAVLLRFIWHLPSCWSHLQIDIGMRSRVRNSVEGCGRVSKLHSGQQLGTSIYLDKSIGL